MVEDVLILLFITAALFLIIGIALLLKRYFLLKNGIKTTAKVVSNNYNYLSTVANRSGFYHPIIKFKTKSNDWVIQELKKGYKNPIKEGVELQIVYNLNFPDEVEINSKFRLTTLPKILISVSILILLYTISIKIG